MPKSLTDPESVVKRAVAALSPLRGSVVTPAVAGEMAAATAAAFPDLAPGDLGEIFGVARISGAELTEEAIEERARQVAALEVTRLYLVGVDLADGPSVTAYAAVDSRGRVLFSREVRS